MKRERERASGDDRGHQPPIFPRVGVGSSDCMAERRQPTTPGYGVPVAPLDDGGDALSPIEPRLSSRSWILLSSSSMRSCWS